MSCCSSCKQPLAEDEEELATESGLIFHRSCLEQLLKPKPKTAYQDRDEEYQASASNKTTNVFTRSSPYSDQTNETEWTCKYCTMANPIAAKRCDTCAKLKHTRLPSTNESTDTEGQHDYSSPSDTYRQTHHDNHTSSRKKVVEDDDSHYTTTSRSSRSDYEPQQIEKVYVGRRHGNQHADQMARSDDDQPSVPYPKTKLSKKAEPTKTRSPSSSPHTHVVYIVNLPSDMTDNLELEHLIRRRTEDVLQAKVASVKCYTKLSIGVVHVGDNRHKDRLINKIGQIVLDPTDGKCFITFVDTIELISYIVLDVSKEQKDDILPTTKEITRRWVDLHKGDEPRSCNVLNAQFSFIYRIVSTSLEEIANVTYNGTCRIKNFVGSIYYCADSCFLEDVPRTITQDRIRETIATDIGQENLLATSMCIRINKQTNTACIITADIAKLWSGKSFLSIDKNTLSKKTTLTCRLLLYPIPTTFSIQKIISHQDLNGAVTNHKHSGDHLILELSDQTVFEQCLERGALRIDKEHVVHVDLCDTTNNPEGSELDADEWYETDMLKYTPDIMQFIAKPQHAIFRYKWNSQIWNEQFKRVAFQKRDAHQNMPADPKNRTADQIRHLLRVTVMLSTLGAIRKRSYKIDEREVKLRLQKELKTIVYDHRSKLEQREKMPLTKTLYSQTTVHVTREDCLVVYERLIKSGNKPLLLNMASATSPGGGFRKGDGAQEETIFRRSDYCRSLDIDLDEFFQENPERSHCLSNCRLESMSAPKNMYPMDEYGAIYTRGITVFRQSEEMGYAFMENSVEDVCALAMAAYREPELKGNVLSPKYAVGTRKKIENMFAIAYHHKHDSLVLSAFGCGAFKNPPDHVVKLFHSVMEQYAGFFKSIVFAIVDDHNAGRQLNPEGNFRPFADALDGTTLQPITPMNKPNTMFGPYRLLSDGISVSDVCILDLKPCNYGSKCTEIYNPHHASQYSHPPVCTQAAISGKCHSTDNATHMVSFIHRNQCRNGGECQQMNDESHSREFDHPDYCSDGGSCKNQKEEHLKQYQHLPCCPKSHKCLDYQKEIMEHCNKFRHCAPYCPHGNNCAMLHDRNHFDDFQHPHPPPCPRTPFHCPHYNALTESKDIRTLSTQIQQHCLTFAHVCKFGRNCPDTTPLHRSKSIHIARHVCSNHGKCNKLNDEEHLNSFTHPNIPDIRPSCPHADKCHDYEKPDHKASFRHSMSHEAGVIPYYGLNENTNFIQNQRDNMTRVDNFINKHKWRPLPSGSIPDEIINWVRTVQPVHRCSPLIFESILLHGHVMSREYMERLKDPKFVANCVLEHSRIRRIEALKMKLYEDDVRQYITALVSLEFERNGFPSAALTTSGWPVVATAPLHTASPYAASHENIIKRKETRLSGVIKTNDMNALRIKATDIAKASIKLHSDPAGIGHAPDKALGTDKQVFSILGPHLGHYYGDVIIIFKREILHHPDANYSIQAATTFPSGNAYNMRPWLGNDSGSVPDRVNDYHRTKLHASIQGYEYATAFELMALTSLHTKTKTMDVTLQQILDRWVKVDSHNNIEAHLPQLIPLDYIDHIYIPKNLLDKLTDDAKKAIDAVFKHCITILEHKGEAHHERKPFGPTPTLKSRHDYQEEVIRTLIARYKKNAAHSSPSFLKGVIMTIPSTAFDDHYRLPVTISQAYTQYRLEQSHPSRDNITYIYWKAMNGDMMLTLANEEIDSDEKQPNLRCLICYVAPISTSNDNHYYEETSYLASAHPFQHAMIINKKSYKGKSSTFHIGCNTSDFITYCLEIHRSTGEVILSHAGPNAIYNQEKMSCRFNRSELDLSRLEYIHVSAGTHTVVLRNLMICFEKQSDLHPTFDKDFKNQIPSRTTTTTRDHDSDRSSHPSSSSKVTTDHEADSPSVLQRIVDFVVGNHGASPKACPNSIYCLIQHSSDGPTHNSTYSHPCRYSELCTERESHLTHEPHEVPKCEYDKNCNKLDDPVHRAACRHTGMSDFLIPCLNQSKCPDKSSKHRRAYFHGEQVFEKSLAIASTATAHHTHPQPHKKHPEHHASAAPIPCRYGMGCYDHDANHRATYSHLPTTKPQKGKDDPRTQCKWGAGCHDSDSGHRSKFSHPPTGKPQREEDGFQTQCKWGVQCHDFNSTHRAKFSHPKK